MNNSCEENITGNTARQEPGFGTSDTTIDDNHSVGRWLERNLSHAYWRAPHPLASLGRVVNQTILPEQRLHIRNLIVFITKRTHLYL